MFAKNYFDKYYPYLAPFILSTIPSHHDLTSSVDKDFQIEVKAEFRDVKMRLNELMALQNGNVLEISDLIKNEIFSMSRWNSKSI